MASELDVSAEVQRFVDRGFSNAGHVRSVLQDEHTRRLRGGEERPAEPELWNRFRWICMMSLGSDVITDAANDPEPLALKERKNNAV